MLRHLFRNGREPARYTKNRNLSENRSDVFPGFLSNFYPPHALPHLHTKDSPMAHKGEYLLNNLPANRSLLSWLCNTLSPILFVITLHPFVLPRLFQTFTIGKHIPSFTLFLDVITSLFPSLCHLISYMLPTMPQSSTNTATYVHNTNASAPIRVQGAWDSAPVEDTTQEARPKTIGPQYIETQRPKVIIVGAGIAGLSLGVLLQLAGIEFRILERMTEFEHAGTQQTRTFPHLSHLFSSQCPFLYPPHYFSLLFVQQLLNHDRFRADIIFFVVSVSTSTLYYTT